MVKTSASFIYSAHLKQPQEVQDKIIYQICKKTTTNKLRCDTAGTGKLKGETVLQPRTNNNKFNREVSDFLNL